MKKKLFDLQKLSLTKFEVSRLDNLNKIYGGYTDLNDGGNPVGTYSGHHGGCPTQSCQACPPNRR